MNGGVLGLPLLDGLYIFQETKHIYNHLLYLLKVQGIWPETADGTDINAVDRSNSSYSGSDSPPDNYFLLASGDDFSQVKVFRYPCIKKGAKAVIGKGHSSHVTNVKFSKQDDYLISTGGEDNCIM